MSGDPGALRLSTSALSARPESAKREEIAPEARNLFTPDDNPALGLYYTAAPDVIAKQLGLAPAAPFILEANASPVPGGWPKGGTGAIALPNNHLAYALTWFSLAFVLLVCFAVFAWQQCTARGGPA